MSSSVNNSSGRNVDIAVWLQSLGLEKYANGFHSYGIVSPLQCLSLSDEILLKDIGVTELSQREAIFKAAHRLSLPPEVNSPDNSSEDSWGSGNSSRPSSSLAIFSGDSLPPPLTESQEDLLDLPPPPEDPGTPTASQEFSFDMPPPPPPPPPPSLLGVSTSSGDSDTNIRNAPNGPSSQVKMNGYANDAVASPPRTQKMFHQASLVNIQQDDIDLDTLLADLMEIEKDSRLGSGSTSPNAAPPRPLSSLSTQSSSASLNQKPPLVTINSTFKTSNTSSQAETVSAPSTTQAPPPPPQKQQQRQASEDDDFSKILADLESLTTSADLPQSATRGDVQAGTEVPAAPAPTSATTGNHSNYVDDDDMPASLVRQPSELDLLQQINALCGNNLLPPIRDVKSPSTSSYSSSSPAVSHLSSSVSQASSLMSSESFTPTSSATSTLSTPRHTSAISPHPSISSASSSSELEELNQLSAHLTRELNNDVTSMSSEDRQPHAHRENAVSDVRTVPNESIIRLPTSKSVAKANEHLADLEKDLASDPSLSQEEKESRLKQAKVQMAMDKLKEANVKKIVLKAYNDDESSKMIVIDDKMTAHEVVQRLIRKNRVKPSPNYVLIEQLADHYLERRIEDHELMVPILECWGVGSPNCIRFTEKADKYMLFKRPQLFMPPGHDFAPGKKSSISEPKKRDLILKDLFVAQALPDLEGHLMVKEGRKGPWKRHYLVFRKSGLYFSPKGKTVATKDLQRFADFRDVSLYTFIDDAHQKKYKAPSELCFTLKRFFSTDSRKMLHFCAEKKEELDAWFMAIRVARYGNVLQENFDRMNRDMPWVMAETEEEIDGLVRLQKQELEEAEQRQQQRMRSGSIGNRLRMGTGNNTLQRKDKGMRQNRASTYAASDLTLRSRGSIRGDSRPASAMAQPTAADDYDNDVEDTSESLTPFQQMFGSAWKQGQAKDATDADTRHIELIEPDFKDGEDFSPTPMATSPFLASEDGMYNLRLT